MKRKFGKIKNAMPGNAFAKALLQPFQKDTDDFPKRYASLSKRYGSFIKKTRIIYQKDAGLFIKCLYDFKFKAFRLSLSGWFT